MDKKGQNKINFPAIMFWMCSFLIILLEGLGHMVVIPICIGTVLGGVVPLVKKIDIGSINIVVIMILCFLPNFVESELFKSSSYTIAFFPFLLYFYVEKERYWRYLVISVIGGAGFCYVTAEILPTALLIVISLLACKLAVEGNELYEIKKEYYKSYVGRQEENIRWRKTYEEVINQQNENITMAKQEERNRISRDLHDSLGHLTSRGILQIGALIVTEQDEEKRKQLELLKSTLQEGMTDVRKSLHNFQNDAINLKEELEAIIENFKFCPVEFKYALGSDQELNFKYSVIYIIKEALANVIKHSDATYVEISLVEMTEMIYIKIFDNGKTRKGSTVNGMGLFSMEKRVMDLGGKFELSTEKGFRIFIAIDKGIKTARVTAGKA